VSRQAIIVADSSPLITLERIGRLELMPALFGAIWLPPAVVREVGPVIAALGWIVVRTPEVALLPPPPPFLGEGEREAIALARMLTAEWLLMDERRGRVVAARFGLKLVGLAGLAVRAKDSGLIPRVGALLEDARLAGCFLSDELLATALRLAGET
jgi:predicted nucleic acid-binding protein